MDQLPSTKPYLMRAIWEWCCDNALTPYMAVDVDEFTQVPREFVRDGQIVLNVGAGATNRLQIANDFVTFQARFGGVARELCVPVERVTAIYARENGAGMSFEIEPYAEQGEAPRPAAAATPEPETPNPPTGGGRPKLQRIK